MNLTMSKPKCEKCKEHEAMTRVYETWVCLYCLDKIDQKQKKERKIWLQNL